jgi:hypothetical protein
MRFVGLPHHAARLLSSTGFGLLCAIPYPSRPRHQSSGRMLVGGERGRRHCTRTGRVGSMLPEYVGRPRKDPQVLAPPPFPLPFLQLVGTGTSSSVSYGCEQHYPPSLASPHPSPPDHPHYPSQHTRPHFGVQQIQGFRLHSPQSLQHASATILPRDHCRWTQLRVLCTACALPHPSRCCHTTHPHWQCRLTYSGGDYCFPLPLACAKGRLYSSFLVHSKGTGVILLASSRWLASTFHLSMVGATTGCQRCACPRLIKPHRPTLS